jgi:hypothetical protein
MLNGSVSGRAALLALAVVFLSAGVSAQTGPGTSFSPTSLSFGNQDVNFPSQPQGITLTNTGTSTLNITRISVTGANSNSFSVSNNCGGSLAAGANCAISVTFTPSSTPGNKTGSVQVSDNAQGSPQLIPLGGTGVDPLLSYSPTKLTFPAQMMGATSAALPLVIKNGATATDSLNVISVSATGDFAETNTCSSPVAAGASCTVNVTFTPTGTGTRTGTIVMSDNAPSKSQTVQVTGTGSTVGVAPVSLTFPTQVVGTSSSAQIVTLSNQGSNALAIASITVTGDFGESNTCGSSLAAGASCPISIVFTPTTTGIRSGTLQISDSDPTSPQSVTLSGTATPVSQLSLSTTSLNYAPQLVGTASKSQSITLRNNGSGTITMSSVTATGDFSAVSGCGKSIGSEAECSITVTFRPTGGGARTGTLTIKDSDPSSPQMISLAGMGTFVQLSQTTVSFAATVLVGKTSTKQTVTVTNTASTALSFTDIEAFGDFTQTDTCASGLNPGANCSVSVTFTPTNSGFRTGGVTFADSDPGSPQTLLLTGTGTLVQLAPPSLNFGNQGVFTASTARNVTLTNMGSSPLNFSDILASGDFSETNNCGGSLAGGSSCSISVTFMPTVAGSRSGSITLNDTDATNIQTVSLSGNGQTASSTVTISPRAYSLTPNQTLQFTSNVGVSWSVDGIPGGDLATTGTISESGLYTPPLAAGSHLVTATSESDSTQTATAEVFVTNFPGAYTWRYDNARDGENLQETVLSTANVNKAQFGKLAAYAVDGQVYAQPLYVPNVTIPGLGTFNVVYVATENDSVYALDADGIYSGPLWQVNFTNPAAGITTVSATEVQSDSVMPTIGITSTPVIDPTTGTLYVVPYTQENGQYVYRLHALDITTGAEKFGGPVQITASVPGNGSGSVSGTVTLSAFKQDQRTGLLLLNGVVYLAFASGHSDSDPYHGWVVGYAAQSLAQVSVFNSTPNGYKGGIWQNSAGLAADDSGNIYALTGNGTFDGNLGGLDYGDSVVKLASPNLAVSDYFAPYNQASLNAIDLDLGSGGPLLVPDQTSGVPHLLITGGKEGSLYVLNRDNMGQFNASGDTQIVQSLPNELPNIFATPAYWQGSIFLAAFNDALKQFRLSNGLLSSLPIAQTSTTYPFPGASPVVTSNGESDGIVWTIQDTANGAPAILRAHDAANVAVELYDSSQSGARDQLDAGVKSTVPMVANGKVYIGTGGHLTIFGLLP